MKYILHNTFSKILLFALFILIFGVFSFVISLPSFAGFYSVKAYDSIAGYGTEIKIGNATSSEKTKIFILPPSGLLQTYLQNANADGTLSFILSPEKTKQAGIYKAVVVESGQGYSDGLVHSFEIFPDDPSNAHSFFYAVDSTVPTGNKGKITVLLRDKHENPIAGHRISLASSRSFEKFTPLGDAKTNDAGEVSFLVQSAYAGDALITAMDETYGSTIKNPLSLRFYKNALSASLLGDSTGQSNGSGQVARFSIDFPETIPMNSDANYLTITALDASGNVVKNFTGNIFITIPTDVNVTIPGEKGVYQFTEADQGRIVFSRSLVFSSAGKHKIEVYSYNPLSDETNFNVFGKKEITVENKTIGTDNPNATPITIESPSSNTVLASKSVILSGKALKNTDLQVLLDKKIIKTIETDDSGNFSTTLFDITTGEHSLQLQQKNNLTILSDSIVFRVGESVGTILSATLSKQVALPKESLDVQVQIETSIAPKSLDASVNGISYPLQMVRSGLYQASFPAPSSVGEYFVSVSLQNSLGEIQEKTIPSKLVVQNTPGGSSGAPTVSGVYAEFIPERKVAQLSWNGVSPEPLLYIIHSGNTASSLQKIKSIAGISQLTEIEMTSFQEKYFAISAVDADGKEGSLSTPVKMIQKATPTPTPVVTPTPAPTLIPTNPPTPTPTALPQMRAVPLENALTITWDSFPNAVTYKISYGQKSNVYQEEVTISSSQKEKRLSDLIGGDIYFIRMEAIGSNGKVLYEYPEISSKVLSTAFHASAMGGPQNYPSWVPQTGPLSSVLLGGLFLLCSAYFMRRRSTKRRR